MEKKNSNNKSETFPGYGKKKNREISTAIKSLFLVRHFKIERIQVIFLSHFHLCCWHWGYMRLFIWSDGQCSYKVDLHMNLSWPWRINWIESRHLFLLLLVSWLCFWTLQWFETLFFSVLNANSSIVLCEYFSSQKTAYQLGRWVKLCSRIQYRNLPEFDLM